MLCDDPAYLTEQMISSRASIASSRHRFADSVGQHASAKVLNFQLFLFSGAEPVELSEDGLSPQASAGALQAALRD